MTNAILRGKPDAGNPHVRFDEGEVASAKPRRGSLLYTALTMDGLPHTGSPHVRFDEGKIASAKPRRSVPHDETETVLLGKVKAGHLVARFAILLLSILSFDAQATPMRRSFQHPTEFKFSPPRRQNVGNAASSTANVLAVNGTSLAFTGSKQHKKIDSGLVWCLSKESQLTSMSNSAGSVELDCNIKCTDVNQVAPILEGMGCVILSKSERFGAIHAYVHPSRVREIAEDPRVTMISEIIPPIHNKVNTSAGDVAHRAATARSEFGVNGNGIKIGVVSDSSRHLLNVQKSGDLPSSVTVLPGLSGVLDDNTDLGEGTAMMEIVHDLCPGASLYFATGGETEEEMAESVLALRDKGCDIIVDDVCFPRESAFQDGIIAQAVNEVTADGCVYVTCAANKGNVETGHGAAWEGDFKSAAQVIVDGVEYEVHGFGSLGNEECNKLRYWAVATATLRGTTISLQWSDAWGSSANDYALALYDYEKSMFVQLSDNPQTGSGCNPIELVEVGRRGGKCWDAKEYQNLSLVILKKKGAANRYLRLSVFDGPFEEWGDVLEFVTPGQVYGHNAAESAICVAAADPVAGRAFTASDVPAYYTSDGPRRLFYDANGVAYTTSLLSGGGKLLDKPDVMGASSVACATPGFELFPGTSASAPHLAAIVGLMLEANKGLSTEDVRAILHKSTFSNSGWNKTVGYGAVDAYAAVKAAQENGVSTPTIPGAPIVRISGTTLSWDAVPGANYYKVYRSTNPFADPVAVTGWRTDRNYPVEKPTAEGACYFYFVKAASAQDDATAGSFNAVKVVTGNSGYTLLQYTADRNYVAYNDDTEFHLYGSAAISATPYSNSSIPQNSSWQIKKSSASSDGKITATINGTSIATSPTYSSILALYSLGISAPANTLATPRSYAFYSTAKTPTGFKSSANGTFAQHYVNWIARPHYIYQAGVNSVSIGKTSQSVDKDGGTFMVNVTATPTTAAWTATVSNNAKDWITPYRTSSSGSGVLGYIVAPNPGSQRTGTITVNGASTTKTLTVTQAGAPPPANKPDLAVQSYHSDWPTGIFLSKHGESTSCASFEEGASVDISLGVGNIGGAATTRTFGTRVSILNSSGTVKYSFVYTNNAVVAAGAEAYSYNHSEWPAFSCLSAGSYVFKAEVDCHGEINESNENNNVASVPFTIVASGGGQSLSVKIPAEGGTRESTISFAVGGSYVFQGSAHPSWITDIRIFATYGGQTFRLGGTGTTTLSLFAGATATLSFTASKNTTGSSLSWDYVISGPDGKAITVTQEAVGQSTLTSIAISGASSVTSGGNTTYTCTATMSDGTTKTVTPTWSISSGGSYASIGTSGKLTANTVASSQPVTVKASYTEGGVTKTATKTVTVYPAPTLATALDNSKLTFTTGGHSAWLSQSTTTHDGVDAARSGSVSDNQNSWMRTTVTGPGTISFWWLVSSEPGYFDFLEFLVDGVRRDVIGGDRPWKRCSFFIGSGTHTLTWNYSKDYSVSAGLDAGFVDQVEWTPGSSSPLDFDGDGRCDIAVYDPKAANWYGEVFGVAQYGWGSTIPTPADYDGDGITDYAAYDQADGAWYILYSADNRYFIPHWGWTGALPVPADYDGDGKIDLAVYSPHKKTGNAGAWYILRSSDGATEIYTWGWDGAIPTPADYDGDGKADLAVFNRLDGFWYIHRSSVGGNDCWVPQYGWKTATPVPADYDGDGIADLGIYDLTTGVWYTFGTSEGHRERTFGWRGAVPLSPIYWIHRWFGL